MRAGGEGCFKDYRNSASYLESERFDAAWYCGLTIPFPSHILQAEENPIPLPMKTVNLLLGLGLVCAIPLQAAGVYEPMNYTPGSALTGQGGWQLTAGTIGTVQSGNLEVSGLASSVGNCYTWSQQPGTVRLSVDPVGSGSLYCSFALRVGQVGNFTGAECIAGFTTGITTLYAPRINLVANSPTTYQIGLSKQSGSSAGILAPDIFSTSDTVFVIARYTFNPNSSMDDTCDLWLNPAPSSFGTASAPAPTVADVGLGATDLSGINRFFFRSSGTGAIQKTADELRIGTTWAEVTPVPEPSSLALLGCCVTVWLPRRPKF